ncbi:MAG: carbohydrate ABC transporter permease [Lachnospiraceae bacterium]|nr:carbohydrate ABC transporter permease [Lachnospiraceae bacterium]
MLHKRMSRIDYLVEAILFFIGIVICICILYPILNILAISVSADGPVLRNEVRLLPRGFTMKAYEEVIVNNGVLRALGNSVFISLAGCLLSVTATYFAAYPIACCEFPGKKIYNIFVLIPMWFQGGMIPAYICVQKLGLINSYWALILTALISSYNVLILSSFLRGIPRELLESARMDGAGELRVMFQVVAPLAKASFATIALWVIAAHWNAYFGPLLYLTDSAKFTLQQVLREIVLEANAVQYDLGTVRPGQPSVNLADQIRYAVLVVSMVPMLAIYPFVQKYFVKGVTLGAVKG